MFIGVDGTGDADGATYGREMGNSFISQIHRACIEPSGRKHYLRGPTLWGREVRAIARQVVALVLNGSQVGDHRICLAGYSRGGAAVIVASQLMDAELRRRGHEIEALFLFDAVDRDAFTDSSIIPGCVARTYHAIRSGVVGSRGYFGNAATATTGGLLEEKWFTGTHSALGGLPWAGDHPDPYIDWKTPRQAGSNPSRIGGRLFGDLGARQGRGVQLGLSPSFLNDPALTVRRGSEPITTAPLGFRKINDVDAMRHVRNWMWPLLVKHKIV